MATDTQSSGRERGTIPETAGRSLGERILAEWKLWVVSFVLGVAFVYSQSPPAPETGVADFLVFGTFFVAALTYTVARILSP